MKETKKQPKLRFPGFTDDWEQRKLGDVCERVTRKNKDGVSDLPLTISSQYGLIDQRNFFNKVVAAKDMSNYYLLKKGEFAYNKSYSNGFDYGSIKRLNAYETGCLSTLYICFSLMADDVDSDFLECYFDTLQWYSDVSQICAEGARNHGLLNVDTKAFFTDVRIKIPKSVDEQKQIALYLNTLDNLITLHQRELDSVKKLKQSMLQKMFPRKGEAVPELRFPGFTGAWEQRKLGEVFRQTSILVDPNTCSMELWSLTVEEGLTPKSERYNREFLVKKDNNFKEVRPGDIVYNPMNMTLGAVGYNGMDKSVAVSGYYTTMITNKGYDSYYINTWLKSPQALTLYKTFATGSLIEKQRVQFPTLSIIPVAFPNYEEQEKIGAYFRTLDNLITLHQRELDGLKKLKKAFLQHMFV